MLLPASNDTSNGYTETSKISVATATTTKSDDNCGTDVVTTEAIVENSKFIS